MVTSARYEELRLRLEEGRTEGSYRVVASAMGAEASGTFSLPFSAMELENFVLKLGRTRKGIRRIESPEMQLARTFGTKLFDAVFDGDVRDLYRHAVNEANQANHGLRITLALSGAPGLMQVPWEYLYDKPDFLSISTWTPVVRYLDLAKPPRPLQLAFPLRILGMVSSPSEVVPLDVGAEQTRVEAALSALLGAGVVTIDWVDEPTLLGLTRQLRKADYHVFHYIGHGGFDADAKDGVLLFEDGRGRGQPVTGRQLGDILRDERTLRLAVLNACEGARASVDDPFSGVATSLIEREIPAVIGMQFEITDAAAIVFASEFYSVLADGQPVDTAVSEARKSIYALGNDIEWGTPVLFMRVADGRLFEMPSHAAIPRPDPGTLVEEVAARAPVDTTTMPPVDPAATVDTPPESALGAGVLADEAAPDDAPVAVELAERGVAALRPAVDDAPGVETGAPENREPPAGDQERPDEAQTGASERERVERQAADRAERERQERARAEAAERERGERQAAETAERERQERARAEAAERERQERARAEAAETAERERQERLAAEAAERARRRQDQEAADERARQERMAALAADANRRSRERAEREAAQQADGEAARRSVTSRAIAPPIPVDRPAERQARRSGSLAGAGTALVLLLVFAGLVGIALMILPGPGPSAAPGAGGIDRPDRTRAARTTAPTVRPAGAIEPENVFNVHEAEAIATLQAQGFTALRVIRVCSSSVPADHLRQIVLDDGREAPNEIIVLDRDGAVRAVPPDTPLKVKIGTGTPCS